jgi:predicted amino acid-binding ACT domain protein
MARWTIEAATDLDFDGVVALKVVLVSGNLSVLAGGDRPSVRVREVEGQPLDVDHDAGMLRITHHNPLWEGLRTWLNGRRCSADVIITVPPDCPVQVDLVGADAVITGLTAGVSVKSATGDVTIDDVSGHVAANTFSGAVEAQHLDGTVDFISVSGDLGLAGGSLDRLSARSVSGRIAADVDLTPAGGIQASTVAGEVTLRLPASVSARIGMNTVGGRIDSSFAELGPADGAMPKNVTGTLGDGAGEVTVTTVSGDITLLSREDYARHGGEPDVEV